MDDLFDDDMQFQGRLSGRLSERHRPNKPTHRSSGSSHTGNRGGGGGPPTRSLSGGQRAAVVASITKMGSRGHAKAMAHARYLQRDGVSEEGRDPRAFTQKDDDIDLGAFVEASHDDRHQFRLIVSPEQSHELELEDYVRDYMDRVQTDVGQPLQWAAVTHYNTDQPHAHVILRGRDALGEDLYINSDYLNKGLRHRAEEVATQHLGPRTREQQDRAHARQREADHWTELDKHLVRAANDENIVRAMEVSRPDDGIYVNAKDAQARLKYLATHDLADARETPRGAWKIDHDLRARLNDRRDERDILRRMQRNDVAPDRWSLSKDPPVAGRVVDRGLSDEVADRHYLLVDGADGRAHHLEVDAAHPARVGDCVEVRRDAQTIDVQRREDPVALVEAKGPIWLDRHLDDPQDHRGGAFGRAWAAAKRRRLTQHERRGHLDEDGRAPADLVKRLREDERRAFRASYARDNGLAEATLNAGESAQGHLSEPVALRGGDVHVLKTDNGECLVVPSNRYLQDHADQPVRLTRKRGKDGRSRTYVDSLDRDRSRNSHDNDGPER